MWYIFKFIEQWILYPPIFTICFIVYYVFYIIILFKLPKINFIDQFLGIDLNHDAMSTFAHILSVYAVGIGLAIFIAFKYLLK
jgi:hypothetical protein